MQFPTLEFLVFFLVVLTVTWLIRRWRTAQKVLLLVASVYFYSRFNLQLAAVLVGTSVAEFLIAELLVRARTVGAKKAWLYVSVAKNLTLLGFFKYYNFFQETVEGVATAMGLSSHVPVLEVLMPLGISFYTFQLMTYTIDLYRGYGVRAKSLLDFMVYATFFPQLVIGPICRSRDLLPQIEAPAPKTIPNLSEAVSLLASGLFKKVVLATFLGTHLVNDAFLAPGDYASVELLVAAYAYCIMIYCDFSGYVDMARGLGLLMGFHLPDNFNMPYKATDIAEFWRRWHITFSNWLRDYVYLPLGGSRRHPLRVYLNLFITLLVAGWWHGATWGYVMWGVVHGVGLVCFKILQDSRRKRGIDPKTLVHPMWWLVVAWMMTLHLNVFARIFFYTSDLPTAFAYLGGLAELSVLGKGVEWLILPATAFGFAMNFWGDRMRASFIRLHESTPWLAKPALWAAIAVGILAMQPDDVAPFIYFMF